MKRVLVPLAEGFEELEAVTVIDILRRAGIEVVVASLAGSPVTGSHGIRIAADTPLAAVVEQDFDMIVLPGGMPGAGHLRNDARIAEFVRRLHARGQPVAVGYAEDGSEGIESVCWGVADAAGSVALGQAFIQPVTPRRLSNACPRPPPADAAAVDNAWARTSS